MRFLHALRARMAGVRAAGLPIVLVGDLNIHRRVVDVHPSSVLIDVERLLAEGAAAPRGAPAGGGSDAARARQAVAAPEPALLQAEVASEHRGAARHHGTNQGANQGDAAPESASENQGANQGDAEYLGAARQLAAGGWDAVRALLASRATEACTVPASSSETGSVARWRLFATSPLDGTMRYHA